MKYKMTYIQRRRCKLNIDWYDAFTIENLPPKILLIFCSFPILCGLDIFQLLPPSISQIVKWLELFPFLVCHPNIFTLQMKVRILEKKNCHPSLSRIFAQKIRIKNRFFKFLTTRTNEMFGIPSNIYVI